MNERAAATLDPHGLAPGQIVVSVSTGAHYRARYAFDGVLVVERDGPMWLGKSTVINTVLFADEWYPLAANTGP